MFKILDGREYFYQWDLNQKLIVEDDSINEVHFSNRTDGCSLVVKVDELRQASVPNILLQDYWDIRVYAYCYSGESKYTKVEEKFEVKKRSKPSDYIYTETEIKIWDNKVDIFQGKENSKKILSTDENGEVITEISVDEIITNKDIPRPTSADNGKYLGCENGAAAWMPVDASEGGVGGKSAFRLMIDITTTEDVAKIEINEDMDGNKLSMRRFIFNVEVPAASGSANAFFGSGAYRWLYGADTAQNGNACSKSLQIGKSKVKWWGEFVMNVEQDGAHAILYMRASKTPYADNVISSDGGTYSRFDVRKYPYSSGAGIYYLHESFDRIFYKTDSSTVMIPAGTKIKVWGVDA